MIIILNTDVFVTKTIPAYVYQGYYDSMCTKIFLTKRIISIILFINDLIMLILKK